MAHWKKCILSCHCYLRSIFVHQLASPRRVRWAPLTQQAKTFSLQHEEIQMTVRQIQLFLAFSKFFDQISDENRRLWRGAVVLRDRSSFPSHIFVQLLRREERKISPFHPPTPPTESFYRVDFSSHSSVEQQHCRMAGRFSTMIKTIDQKRHGMMKIAICAPMPGLLKEPQRSFREKLVPM